MWSRSRIREGAPGQGERGDMSGPPELITKKGSCIGTMNLMREGEIGESRGKCVASPERKSV